jgi:hypothetical protein
LEKASPSSGDRAALDFITEMLATKDGMALVKAFSRIENQRLKRTIVHLVEDLGNGLR